MSTLIAAATMIVAATPSDSSSAGTGYIRSSSAKIMAIACTALILFIVLMVFVLARIYSKYFFIRRRQRQGLLYLVSPSQPRQATPKVGLHKSLLDLLPTFVYTSHSSCSKERLECAVCLSDFQEQEQGRRLPQCGHIFHTACIDKWFSSNSTCPLCRIEVKEELVGAVAGTDVSLPSPTLSVGSPVCITVSHSSERRLESSEEEATGVAASCFDGIIHASAEKQEKTADHPALPQLNQTLQPESFHCPVNSQATARSKKAPHLAIQVPRPSASANCMISVACSKAADHSSSSSTCKSPLSHITSMRWLLPKDRGVTPPSGSSITHTDRGCVPAGFRPNTQTSSSLSELHKAL